RGRISPRIRACHRDAPRQGDSRTRATRPGSPCSRQVHLGGALPQLRRELSLPRTEGSKGTQQAREKWVPAIVAGTAIGERGCQGLILAPTSEAAKNS